MKLINLKNNKAGILVFLQEQEKNILCLIPDVYKGATIVDRAEFNILGTVKDINIEKSIVILNDGSEFDANTVITLVGYMHKDVYDYVGKPVYGIIEVNGLKAAKQKNFENPEKYAEYKTNYLRTRRKAYIIDYTAKRVNGFVIFHKYESRLYTYEEVFNGVKGIFKEDATDASIHEVLLEKFV